jgi:diguanylate cyclase (GGDEF)-like protein
MIKLSVAAASARSNIAAEAAGPADRETPLRHRWLRWVVLLVGIVGSLGGASFYQLGVEHKAHAEFRSLAIGKTSEIGLRTRAYSEVLYALRGLLDASAAVTRDDFHQFAEAFSIVERYPGLTNISYSPLITHARRRAFELAVRAETSELTRGLPEFSIKPPGERPSYVVLHYVEPLTKNVPAWGLDLLSDPARRAPVERARDSGVVTSVSGITLLRDGKSAMTSALLRLAVYRGGGVPNSPAERQRLFSGVVGSTLRIGELIEATLKADVLARMRVRILANADTAIANSAAPAERVLYDSLSVDRVAATTDYPAYAVSQNLAVGDGTWRVVITPLVNPVDVFGFAMVSVVLTVSLALSGLLFWLMSSLATVQLREAALALRGREAVLLRSLGEDLHSCQTVQEACRVFATRMPALLAKTSGVLYEINASRSRAVTAAQWGAPVAVAGEFAPAACEAIRRGHLFRVAAAATSLNCSHFTDTPPESYSCVPLIAHGEVIGMLHVQGCTRAGDTPVHGDAELNAIKAIAQHLSLALANLSLREKLFERATRDNLTGLYNRHYMREWFEKELLRAGRHPRSIGMIMVDVDHFKRVNDNFGHDAGDMVLRELAAVIRRVMRSSDVACRHGGEEFLLLMPEATPDGAFAKAETLRGEVAGLALVYEMQRITVTISAGVAVYPEHGADVDALLRAADEALYAAKGTGRNRVMMYAARPASTARIGARAAPKNPVLPPALGRNANQGKPGDKAA